MSSVAHGPAMCTPRIGPPRSDTIFTMPSVSPMISARPLPPHRWTEVSTS